MINRQRPPNHFRFPIDHRQANVLAKSFGPSDSGTQCPYQIISRIAATALFYLPVKASRTSRTRITLALSSVVNGEPLRIAQTDLPPIGICMASSTIAITLDLSNSAPAWLFGRPQRHFGSNRRSCLAMQSISRPLGELCWHQQSKLTLTLPKVFQANRPSTVLLFFLTPVKEVKARSAEWPFRRNLAPFCRTLQLAFQRSR